MKKVTVVLLIVSFLLVGSANQSLVDLASDKDDPSGPYTDEVIL